MRIFDLSFLLNDKIAHFKGSYLYENVDDHHERSIHDHQGLKNARQNMIISGKLSRVSFDQGLWFSVEKWPPYENMIDQEEALLHELFMIHAAKTDQED